MRHGPDCTLGAGHGRGWRWWKCIKDEEKDQGVVNDSLLVALQKFGQMTEVVHTTHDDRTGPVARHQHGPVELKCKFGLISPRFELESEREKEEVRESEVKHVS